MSTPSEFGLQGTPTFLDEGSSSSHAVSTYFRPGTFHTSFHSTLITTLWDENGDYLYFIDEEIEVQITDLTYQGHDASTEEGEGLHPLGRAPEPVLSPPYCPVNTMTCATTTKDPPRSL